jgi:uncharacterized Fe-S cluster-containing radical SAM superfamily protein
MDIQDTFMLYREKIFNSDSREFLISRIADSEQEKDLSLPPNCNGYGRIRHFKRILDEDWYDPLPMDPMSKSLNLPYKDLVQAQVFQIASCNLRCWYCFVPDSLKIGNKTNATWFTAEQMTHMFFETDNDIRVIDLSGGNPELAPEWLIDTMKAIEKRGLIDSVYLWSDDTLTTDYFFRFLSNSEMQYIKNYPHYGKVGCFKGFDEKSFSFNTNLNAHFFEQQFELFKRYLDLGIDIYGYVTFTTANIENLEEGIHKFIYRLLNIHPLLPLRIVPLKIVMFTPVGHRLNEIYEIAMKNQFLVHQEWRRQLHSIYSNVQIKERICDVILS